MNNTYEDLLAEKEQLIKVSKRILKKRQPQDPKVLNDILLQTIKHFNNISRLAAANQLVPGVDEQFTSMKGLLNEFVGKK